jgi:hypothetical protein
MLELLGYFVVIAVILIVASLFFYGLGYAIGRGIMDAWYEEFEIVVKPKKSLPKNLKSPN